MNKSFLARCAMLIMAVAVCVGVSQVRQDQAVQRPLSLRIAVKKFRFKSGEPVLVNATVKNNSEQMYSLGKERTRDMDQGGWTYKVDVWDQQGRRGTETTFHRKVLGHLTPEEAANEELPLRSGFFALLKPGATATDEVNVSKLYDVSRPGKYTIQFQLPGESVTSNKITVTVAQ